MPNKANSTCTFSLSFLLPTGGREREHVVISGLLRPEIACSEPPASVQAILHLIGLVMLEQQQQYVRLGGPGIKTLGEGIGGMIGRERQERESL